MTPRDHKIFCIVHRRHSEPFSLCSECFDESEKFKKSEKVLVEELKKNQQYDAIRIHELQLQLSDTLTWYEAAVNVAKKYLEMAHLDEWNEAGMFKTIEVQNKANKITDKEIEKEFQRLKGKG